MAVTTTLGAIDKVNLVDDERLDIPDTLALQELVSEYVIRMLGGVFGGVRKPGDSTQFTVSGALNYLKFNPSVLASTSIDNKAMLLNFRSNSTGDDEGQVVWYNPALVGQKTTIDLSGQVGISPVYIWAQRVDLPADADTRKKWSAGAETTFSLATRQRHRVDWAVNASDHRIATGDNTWFVVAEIESWAGSQPIFRTWHPFDAGSPNSSGVDDSWTDVKLYASADGETVGVNQALRVILNRLALHRKADGSVHPVTTDPDRGLDDLDAALTATDANVAALAFSKVGYIRMIYKGAGDSWDFDAAVVNNTGISSIDPLTNREWLLEVSFNADIQAAFTSVNGSTYTSSATYPASEFPVDVAVRHAHNSADPSKLRLFLTTMAHLESNSWSWSTSFPPTGYPPVGTVVEVTVLLTS
jgi:hypothetical protein